MTGFKTEVVECDVLICGGATRRKALAYCTRVSNPFSLGHSPIIACRHCVGFFDLPTKEMTPCMELPVHEQKELGDKFNPDSFTVGVNVGKAAGQSFLHDHIHLILRHTGDSSHPQGEVRQVIPDTADYPRYRRGQ